MYILDILLQHDVSHLFAQIRSFASYIEGDTVFSSLWSNIAHGKALGSNIVVLEVDVE